MPVYYLNADFNYRQMIDYNELDIDCVHTVARFKSNSRKPVGNDMKSKV